MKIPEQSRRRAAAIASILNIINKNEIRRGITRRPEDNYMSPFLVFGCIFSFRLTLCLAKGIFLLARDHKENKQNERMTITTFVTNIKFRMKNMDTGFTVSCRHTAWQ